MATEPLTTKHDSAKTVYFRLFDVNVPAVPLGWCVTHSAWEAVPHDPKVPATEETIAGDADESLYAATVDLALLYNSATPKAFAVQAVDDLATDEIISVGEITLSSGRNVSSNADVLSSTRSTQAQVWSDGTPVAGIALNTLASHDPGETIMGATDLGTGAGFTSLAQSSVATEQRLAELDAVNLPGVLDTVAADVVNIDGWNPATTGVTAVAGDVGGKVLGGGASVISGTGARVVDGSGNAVATTANQTTILARLGAWTGSARNTLLGAFQALFRSDADATVPGDVNADLGSVVGTAVNTTDSTQAIRDALPAAGGASLTAQQVRDAMKLAPTEGSPTAGSVDDHLDLVALEATLTAMKGAGWLAATDTLEKVRDAIDGIGVDVVNVQTAITNILADIQGVGWTNETLKALYDLVALTSHPIGSYTITLTLCETDETTPIPDQVVTLQTSDGTFLYSAVSDAAGQVVFQRSPGIYKLLPRTVPQFDWQSLTGGA